MNDTCRKTTHTRIMDRCFTIISSSKGLCLRSSPLGVNCVYYELLIKFAIFHTHHQIFIKFMLVIRNNHEIITVWCQSEMFIVAAVTVSCYTALVTGKKWYMTYTPDETR